MASSLALFGGGGSPQDHGQSQYPNVEVVPQTSIQFREVFALYAGRLDKAWSLTDCASFALMTERDISEALAHDHHFEQAGFTALLRLAE